MRLLKIRKLNFEYRITLGYIIVGGLWIIFSDKLLISFIRDPDALTRIQTFKGWFYVIITAFLFYLLLKSHLIKIRNAEQKAIDSDRLKTAFLQNISHEIRTPMNSIVGFSQLLKDDGITENEREQYLDLISKSSDQLLNIVNEVLDISLIETGNTAVNYKNVFLNKLLDDLCQIYYPQISDRIEFSLTKDLSDSESYIRTDATKVRQIINNLLNNALKFTDKGYVHFGYLRKGAELEFYIEDTGIGIDADYHEKIFDRFLKVGKDNIRLYDGVGLGLAICKGNVDLLKGRIWIDSLPGIGSKFYFTIPYEPVESDEPTSIKHVKTPGDFGKLVILVAEDDDVNFLYINEIFRGTGAEILHAVNGKEAVDMCRNDERIGLVLIDIKMPVMNGYEAIRKIREFRPGVPIIAQTAFALSNEMLKAFNAGSNDYISKPFKKEELLEIVTKNRLPSNQ